jgi:hypothetical protein
MTFKTLEGFSLYTLGTDPIEDTVSNSTSSVALLHHMFIAVEMCLIATVWQQTIFSVVMSQYKCVFCFPNHDL